MKSISTATFLSLVTPNTAISKRTTRVLALFLALSFLLAWLLSPSKIIPTPVEVWGAFLRLWSQGFAADLYASFTLNLEALAISTVLSLGLSYLLVMPVFYPLVNIISKLRFMGLVGWSLAFTLLFGGGHYLKVALLVFGMTVFFVTSMSNVITNIIKESLDHARTLRMGPWRVWLEVDILDTLPDAWDCMKQNAAIGWMMLTMVEGLSRSEGGVGVMLLSENKFFKLDGIAAVNLSILLLALCQDYGLGVFKNFMYPHHVMGKERK